MEPTTDGEACQPTPATTQEACQPNPAPTAEACQGSRPATAEACEDLPPPVAEASPQSARVCQCGRPVLARSMCRKCYRRWLADQQAAGTFPRIRRSQGRPGRTSTIGVNGFLVLRAMNLWHDSKGYWPVALDLILEIQKAAVVKYGEACRRSVVSAQARNLRIGLAELLRAGVVAYQLVPTSRTRPRNRLPRP